MIVNCYRPPSGSIAEFFSDLHNALDNIDRLDEFKLFVLGDFNIPYNCPSPGFEFPGNRITNTLVLIVRKKITNNLPKVTFRCRSFASYIKEDFQEQLARHVTGQCSFPRLLVLMKNGQKRPRPSTWSLTPFVHTNTIKEKIRPVLA